MSSRNFNFSQAANNGITVLPDLNLGLPAVGNVLSVKATTGGVVTTAFTVPAGSVTGVSSFNTRTGAVTLNSGDVTTALTFTPYNATNPNLYQTASQVSTALAAYLPLGGGTMAGPLVLSGLPTAGTEAASKNYVDSRFSSSNRNLAKLQAQWVTSAVVTNDTVYLAYDAPYAGTINSLTYFTGNGSFSVAIQINGVSVTGLSAVAVSSATPATANATAANTFTAGQRITAVITAATGSPTDALLSLAVTWS